MIKRLLTILSIVALMATSFVVSPVAAETPPVALGWSSTDNLYYYYSAKIIPGPMDGGEETVLKSGDGGSIFNGEDYLLPFTMLSKWGTATLTVSAHSDSTSLLYISATGYGDTSNVNDFSTSVTGKSSIPLYMYEDGESGNPFDVLIEVTYSFSASVFDSVNPNSNSHYFDVSSYGIDGNGKIFEGVIYVDSWAVIEVPLDMLYNFDMSLSPGYITSFDVKAGLFIEIQGLYQYMSGSNSVSFYDWIGNSPIPRGEEEESYYWYITLTGSAGWYDLQIYVDFV